MRLIKNKEIVFEKCLSVFECVRVIMCVFECVCVCARMSMRVCVCLRVREKRRRQEKLSHAKDLKLCLGGRILITFYPLLILLELNRFSHF